MSRKSDNTTIKPHSRHRILYGFLGVFVLFIFIAVIAFMFPERWLRPFLGEKGASALGRDFAIDGSLDIDWGWPVTRLQAEKIRIGNVPESKDPNMVEIASLDLSIRIPDLFVGRAALPELTITKPQVILEKKTDGSRNWDFPALSKGAAATDAALPDNRGDFPVIGQLKITDGTLIYRDEKKKLNTKLNLSTVMGSSGKGQGKIVLEGDGSLQGQAFKISAEGGSIESLRNTTEAYPLSIALTMGATDVSMKGEFKDPVKLAGIKGTLKFSGNTLSDLFYLTGIPLPPTPPYSISGDLGKDGKIWSYNNMQGKVGDSDLSGNLSYDLSGKRGFVKADLVSNVLDIDDIGGFIGVAPSTGQGETAAPEQKQQAVEQRASARLLPDIPINLNRLRAADMDVTLDARDIRSPGWPLSSVKTRFDLKEGLLKLDPITMGVSGGTAEGALIFDGRQDLPDVTVDLDLKKLTLKGFFEGTRFEDLSAGVFGGHIKLQGKGKSLAEVLGVSNGRITMTMSGGKISLLLVEAAGIDIAEATPLLLGSDETTDIRCIVGDFGVNNGMLKSDIFVFDTTDSNIEGSASISLKEETIDARVETHPKDGSLLSARTPIVISGPLKSPGIGIDPAEAGARGAGAAILGAVLTPLAAIIPFIELGLGEDSNCGALLGQARARASAPVKE